MGTINDVSSFFQIMLGAKQVTSHYDGLVYWCIYAVFSLNDLGQYHACWYPGFLCDEVNPNQVNSLAPGRCSGILELAFQTHIKDKFLEHFLWNCPQVNAIGQGRIVIKPDWSFPDINKLFAYGFMPTMQAPVMPSLAPGRFERHFSYVIFKLMLVIVGWGFSCEIELRQMSLNFTDDISTLVQVMA